MTIRMCVSAGDNIRFLLYLVVTVSFFPHFFLILLCLQAEPREMTQNLEGNQWDCCIRN